MDVVPSAEVTDGHVLLVEDDEDIGRLLEVQLAVAMYRVRWVRSATECLDALSGDEFDVVVTDLGLPGMNGIDLCSRIVANRPDVPVIVITAHNRIDAAVAAIRAGAYDFIAKPIRPAQLEIALKRALNHRTLREKVRRLERETKSVDPLLHSSSNAIRKAYDMIDRVAAVESSVLLTGQSGTGKELAARSLHARSPRAKGPFVAINCAAIPEPLLESELFGHAKGSFTDAKQARPGLFVQANGGSLFLDEIGDMPLSFQPKILRALQDRVVRPVGSDREVPFDARIISATHRDLEAAVEDGRFREDLFFRIHVIAIKLPSLHEREGDVLLLAQHFLDVFAARAKKKITSISPAVASCLMNYEWPGNVRELQNCIERAVALARFEQLSVEDLPERVAQYQPSRVVLPTETTSDILPLEEIERRYILKALEATRGSRTEAARCLGIDRKTLYRKLIRYGVAANEPEPD